MDYRELECAENDARICDVKSVSQDSPVDKTNIHYPTNNSLVWDCVKTSTKLLEQLKQEVDTLDFIDYTAALRKKGRRRIFCL